MVLSCVDARSAEIRPRAASSAQSCLPSTSPRTVPRCLPMRVGWARKASCQSVFMRPIGRGRTQPGSRFAILQDRRAAGARQEFDQVERSTKEEPGRTAGARWVRLVGVLGSAPPLPSSIPADAENSEVRIQRRFREEGCPIEGLGTCPLDYPCRVGRPMHSSGLASLLASAKVASDAAHPGW